MTDIKNFDAAVERALREQTPPTPEPQILTPEQIRTLTNLGFDHVPTVEELREAKARRQAQVREEVLFQADRRSWCEDGTRQVCANLRLQRPGSRVTHKVTYRVTMDVEIEIASWTDKGALAIGLNAARLPVDGRSYAVNRVTNPVIENLTVNGTTYELTEDLRKELTSER